MFERYFVAYGVRIGRFAGKTTLVRAWLEAGAMSYSDEFAVLERAGRVHPFARPLAIRDGSTALTRRVPVAALGAETETTPLSIGLVLVTSYRAGARRTAFAGLRGEARPLVSAVVTHVPTPLLSALPQRRAI